MNGKELTQECVLRRYPRLVAHMICESLGYFTPRAAANALIAYKLGRPFYCEMYCHAAQFRNARRDLHDKGSVWTVTRDFPRQAFKNRAHHKGYMAEYAHARAIVAAALKGNHPVLASWF